MAELVTAGQEREQRAHDDGTGVPVFLGALGRTAPPRRGTKELLDAYREQPWLRAIVHRIAESVATTAWTLAVPGSQRARASMRAMRVGTYAARQRARRQAELQPIETHPMLTLLDDGNGASASGAEIWQVVQTHLDLVGEAFVGIVRNAAGMPIELWPLPPSWVRDVPSNGSVFRVSAPGGVERLVPRQDVLWIRDPDPADPYGRGSGTALSLADELDTDEYAARWSKAFFANNATPRAIVGFEGASAPSVEAAEKVWRQRFRGADRAHQVMFTSHPPSVAELESTPETTNVVQLRQWLRDIAQQVFGVPPEILGIVENSNRATIAAAESIYARWVLVPRLDRIRAALQAQLAPQFDPRLIVDFESPVPSDDDRELDVMTAAPWAFTRGEWREAGGREARDGDDVHMLPLQLVEQDAPRQAPAARTVPQRRASQGDIEGVLAALTPERMQAQVEPVMGERLASWVERTAEELGVSVSFGLINPLVRPHIREVAGTRIKGITDTTRDELRIALSDGVLAGEGARDLAARVRDVFAEADRRRSIVIARTEVLRSANWGTWQAHKISGVVDAREWLTTIDGREREEHAAIDGQRVGIDAPFVIDDAKAFHPGGFGVARLDIQCRCTTLPITRERGGPDDAEVRAQLWRQFDSRAVEWERAMVTAIRRGLDDQAEDVLSRLATLVPA